MVNKSNNKIAKCAPYINNNNSNALKNICYTENGLIKIAKAWNKDNPDNKIKIPKIKKSYNKSNKSIKINKISKKSNKTSKKNHKKRKTNTKSNFKLTIKQREQLWNDIQNKMHKQCNNDICIKKQDFINNNIDDDDKDIDVFVPEMPNKWNDNPREWLNTLNINDVLYQYEKAYPNFIYLGAVPIDFDKKLGFGECVINELCKINLKKLYNRGKTKIGIVFNTDPHNKPGQHWIAMYCDISNKSTGNIYYWDSYGIEPPQEVLNLANKLKYQGEKLLNKKMIIKINKNRHQYKNTECGIYSIHFIIQLLEGKLFTNVCNNTISDDEIANYRKIYYHN